MSLPNFNFISRDFSPSLDGDFHAPNDPAITVSDYFAVTQNATAITFQRPTSDGQGYEFTNPGARVRFNTVSRRIDIVLEYTNLVTRMDTYNGTGAVYADGVLIGTFNRGQGAAGEIIVSKIFANDDNRLIEVVMPYCASVRFKGVYVRTGAAFTAPAARTALKYLALGDSITHGFNASAHHLHWPSLLAEANNWQLLNHGYGGRQLAASDGLIAAAADPDVATYLIGFNNYYPDTGVAAFQTNYTTFLTNFRASTACKLYCITPLWTAFAPGEGPVDPGSEPIEDYRQAIRDAVDDFGDAGITVIEGETLGTNSLAGKPDGIHPGDDDSVQIAADLQPIVQI